MDKHCHVDFMPAIKVVRHFHRGGRFALVSLHVPVRASIHCFAIAVLNFQYICDFSGKFL